MSTAFKKSIHLMLQIQKITTIMDSIKKKIINFINSDEIFKVDKTIMQKTGSWLYQSSYNWKLLTGFFCHLFFNLGPKSNKMVKAFAGSDFKMIAKSFPESITVVSYLTFTFILMKNKKILKEFYDQLCFEWKNGKIKFPLITIIVLISIICLQQI